MNATGWGSSTVPTVAELDHEDHLARGQREVLVLLRRAAAVQVRHLRVRQREEVVAVRVQEVGHAGTEALVRELQRPLDLVTRGLDADALAAEWHRPSIARRR